VATNTVKPNPSKSVVSTFHLNNRLENQKLTVNFCGQPARHDPLPVYLGITLDRILTYKEHLKKVKSKLKTRSSLISKLTGTTWGASSQILRTSTSLQLRRRGITENYTYNLGFTPTQ